MSKTRLLAHPSAEALWTAADAREMLRRQASSGLSVPAFARREGIHPQRLYWWRRKLSPATAPEFVEVTEQLQGGTVVEVILRSGRVLRVPAQIEPGVLRRIADALEQDGPC